MGDWHHDLILRHLEEISRELAAIHQLLILINAKTQKLPISTDVGGVLMDGD